MSTTDIKLSILERLMFVENKGLLQRLHELLDQADADWEPTPAERRELDARKAKRISGESVGLSRKEAIAKLRARR